MAFQRMGAGAYDQTHTPLPIPLGSGDLFMIPTGQYQVLPGPFTFLQWYDPITTLWRTLQTATQNAGIPVSSDGFNWRRPNLTGCVVGGAFTGAASGLTHG